MRISRRDRRLFARAALIAFLGENKVRVGAVLSKGRTVLAEQCNKHRNPVKNVEYRQATWHAERRALRQHEHRFGLTLYVARLSQDDKLMPSFPCADCYEHIHYGTAVDTLVYMDGEHNLRKMRV